MEAGVRVRVAALVLWRDRILFVRQAKNGRVYWLLPGGGVETGETLVAAVRREVREECWITIAEIAGPIALAESIAPAGDGSGRHVIHLIFEASVADAALEAVASADAAISGHDLVERSELAGMDLRPPIRRFLERYEPGDPFVALGRVWVN